MDKIRLHLQVIKIFQFSSLQKLMFIKDILYRSHKYLLTYQDNFEIQAHKVNIIRKTIVAQVLAIHKST